MELFNLEFCSTSTSFGIICICILHWFRLIFYAQNMRLNLWVVRRCVPTSLHSSSNHPSGNKSSIENIRVVRWVREKLFRYRVASIEDQIDTKWMKIRNQENQLASVYKLIWRGKGGASAASLLVILLNNYLLTMSLRPVRVHYANNSLFNVELNGEGDDIISKHNRVSPWC